ncbi:MAG: hypothetical protein Barrevirus25_9 [Barrevirus sp.]|uniref:Uncharacterized protein n=1 Tax=Barrevirus sp. TaxID=2487763 RepID=A0A3G4ZQT6_9VIRU|nr:MAG: hypothetical protein Barrevirus25_9 [Barrevirus sp.]
MHVLSAVLIGIFMVGIPIAFGISSVYIGSQNMNTLCDKTVSSWFLSLSTWLIVYGSITLFYGVLSVATLTLWITQHNSFSGLYLGTVIPIGLFMFAWNIVGAVALFRDAYPCQTQAYSLWAMVLAVLIIQWIGYVFSGVISKTTKSK